MNLMEIELDETKETDKKETEEARKQAEKLTALT